MFLIASHATLGGPHGPEIPKYRRNNRQYAGGADQSFGAAGREPFRKDRSLQPSWFSEGPIGSRGNRGGRKIGRASAWPDGRRGDKWKYGNWSCHGLRSQGIPACDHHGRAI